VGIMSTAVDQISQTHQAGARDGQPVSPPRRRILFLIDEIQRLDDGGTERQVLQLIHLAARLGYDPQLAVLRGSEWLRDGSAGCPVHFAAVKSVFGVSGRRACRRLIRWMRRERFTIVQTFFAESNILGPWMARRADIPVVLGTRRNLDQSGGRSPWLSALMRFAQRLANRSVDGIVVNSQMVADSISDARGTARAKMRVAYNGIDLAAFSGLDRLRSEARKSLGVEDEEILVGNISCMRPVKGLLQFVDAARLALDSDPSLRFVVVGDGEQEQEIIERIREHRIGDRVRLAGGQRNVLPFLAAMDIGVLSSLAEGFSNSLLEYMAAGLPIVATDVGGNREALTDGKAPETAGILVPPNHPQALAQAILSLRSPLVRRQMGEAARRSAERFSLERAEQRMEELYNEFLTARGILLQ